ncbi:hypothetical protein Tco_0876784 [Tanacetum coccineum]|uniref:Uncharacterized protein n=1 Tax=Tanacetum coccineum TaxID=301880 RepID=A0ABQ5BWR1_9ASTR
MKSADVLIINDDAEEESAGDTLIRKKGKGIVEIKDSPPPTPIRSPRTHTTPLSLDKEKLQELKTSNSTPSSSKPITSFTLKPKLDQVNHYKSVFYKMSRVVAEAIKHERQNVKKEIASMVAEAVQKERENLRAKLSGHVTNDVANIVPSKIKFERHTPLVETCRTVVVRTRDHEDHHDDDARPEGKSGAKRQKTSKNEHLQWNYWLKCLREMTSDDIQIMQNAINIMMRDRCNLGKEHQYHHDQMESYMRNQNVWESREEDLTMQIPKKPALVYLSYARNPKIPPMSLVNRDLFYLKYGKSGIRKYIPSLYKIHVVPFPEDDLEELNTKWVKKTIKKFNHYARYVFDQGYEPEYMTEIVVKRADGEYSEYTEPDYKYLHKNDIDVIYLMCINGMIKGYRQTRLLRSLILFIRRIEEEKLLSITFEHVVGLVYENSKQEKRVMDIKEIPKFCDATLKRVLEKVKKFNLNVKYGYADPNLSVEDALYMRFYEEYIIDLLRHRNQIRRWESYVNRRPLEQRNERLE